MKRLIVLTGLLAVLGLVSTAGVAFGQPPAGPTTVAEQRFEAANPPAQAEVLQVVLDFAPGSWTPVHTHGGPVYVTVLAGEVTLRMGGSDQKFGVGEGWIDNPDEPHAAGNDGAAAARVVATFVLPQGATPTIVAETGAAADLPPGPTTVAQFRTAASGLPSPMDVVQRLIEYAPGASGAAHSHPGPNHVTVLDGELTVREGQAERKVSALQTFVEPAGQVHSAHNLGAARTRVVATALVPRGAPYSTAVEQPAPAAAPARQPAPLPAGPAPAPAQVPRSR